ncbi:MAG: hypothetical protein IPK63_10510 [Candidatus Competibacteraceae bacterium]|nr:hypothetical protein [Candidatus Competibacteraceae bacterium]
MLDDLDKPESRERQDRELKSQIVHLAIEAYRREEISRGKLLDLSKKLELPGRKLIELAGSRQGRLVTGVLLDSLL